jgi:hypothetical protein
MVSPSRVRASVEIFGQVVGRFKSLVDMSIEGELPAPTGRPPAQPAG